jgi:hypothetical protein
MNAPATPLVRLPPLAAPVDQLWHVLLDLAESLTVGWTLVGGQMVLLHALEHGQAPAQISQDGDIIADVRTHPRAIATVVAALEAAGFHADGISPEGLAHRYVRPTTGHRPVTVDVLAPEGLGPRADLTTTPPGRTLEVPAGSQALARTEWITVEHEGRTGRLPRPSLLAAIIGKSAAIPLPGGAERHLRDLALLLCLVQDPLALRGELTAKDRTRLALARPLLDGAHLAWTLAPPALRADGPTALRILLNPA